MDEVTDVVATGGALPSWENVCDAIVEEGRGLGLELTESDAAQVFIAAAAWLMPVPPAGFSMADGDGAQRRAVREAIRAYEAMRWLGAASEGGLSQ